MARNCPFCLAEISGARCGSCGRDPTAARRVCKRCREWTPSGETVCSRCGARVTSSLRWKVPVIILIFAAAFALSILVYTLD